MKTLRSLGIFASVVLVSASAFAQDGTPSPSVDAADAASALLRPPGMPTDQEAAFSDYESALEAYEAEMADYRETITEVVEVEYRRERERRLEFYNANIDLLRIEERIRRTQAIADFERFLERFPSHPDYTPDVLFRLAELHYEKSVDDYNQADTGYQLALERYELGIDPDPPEEPRKDFTASIQLFRRLISAFPDYRQLDGAFYLTGVCYDQMDDYQTARSAFGELVERYPESAFAQEAYLRLGEYHFDDAAFEEALAAYELALSYGESKWYDKILFKLGWSTYLLGDFDGAIGHFTSLLAWYEAETEDGAAALEEEALQYFAISIAEEDWDLDGETDPTFVMPRVEQYLGGDEEFSSDVLDRLAGILMENQRFEYSIEVNQYAIARFECDPRNLDRALQMVEASMQLRNFDEALAMQRELTENFGPGSEWYACMERLGEMDAVAQAEQVVKDNLVETAARYYTAAQETRNEALGMGDPIVLAQSQEEFSFAANIYGDFVSQYPDDPLTYEMTMYYAQALLFAARYEEAGAQFGVVRDSLLSDQFRELSAALAIQSYEYALEIEIDAYQLEGRAWPAYDGENQWVVEEDPEPDDDEPRAPPVIEPAEIPALSLAWASAIDRYLELGLNSEDDPRTAFRYGFQVGKLYYDHESYDEAEIRFLQVLAACSQNAPESGYAAGFLLNIYQKRSDTTAVLAFRESLQGEYANCIPPDVRSVLEGDVARMSCGISADSAEAFVDAGDYEAAAEEYARLANEFADIGECAPIGVFNSGLIYEQNLRRYEDAIAQFDRIIRDYPESEFVDDAHVRIAVNARRFFDFDRAISELLILHEIGFSDIELIEYPRYDAALLMEDVGRSREAAGIYVEWAREYPNHPQAPVALYKAGAIYDDLDDHRTMRNIFDEFRAEYGNTTNGVIDIDAAVIDTYHRSAVAHAEEGDMRDARRDHDSILAEYALRLPEAVAPRYAAAQVIYDRAVETFNEWDSIEMGDTVREQTEALQDRIAGIEPVVLEFRVVEEYGSAEWTVCAYYMEGRVFQTLGDLLFRLPVPDFGDDIDAEDEYVLMVEGFAEQYENQAIDAWLVAYPIMQQLGVTNQCTVDMTAQLNRYRGAEYPVFRPAAEYEETGIFSPLPMAPPEPVDEPVFESGQDADLEDEEETFVDDPFGG